MVLGLRTKNRKGNLFQVDYTVYVKEINPWTPLQSLRSAQSVLLQWENGDQSSGSLTSSIGNGKIEFSESFRLPVTLCQEASRKSTNRDSFQKNCLEFYLYEPRKDKVAKGQLLGSAVVNLADYGIIKETITISTPISLTKNSRNIEHPVLYLNIQPFDKESSSSSMKGSLSKEVSLDKDGSESVSESINEGNDEETEIASFTDDDDISSHSSQTISSSIFDPSKESHSQHDKKQSESANGGRGRLGLTLSSGGTSANLGVSPVVEAFKQGNGNTSPSSSIELSSNPENPVTDPMGKVSSLETCVTIPVDLNLDHVKDKDSQTKREGDRKSWRHDQSHVDRSLSSISHVGHWKGNEEKSSWEDELESQILDPEEYSLQDRLGFRPPQDSTRRQITLRSNTLASSLATTEVKGGFVANDRQKHVTSVQLHFDKAKSNGPSKKIQFVEKAKENDILEKIPNDNTSDILSEREETANNLSNSKVDSDKSYGLLKKTQFMEKAKENDIPEKIHNGSTNDTCNETEENANTFSKGKVELESKIEMLEEELREAAVVEASLYSVIAEHGSSTNKVHAPARRLSRFYIHACRRSTQDKRASAARAAVSGLVLVSKACGNDVPRLTFWLSNSIVLRAIVSHAIGEMQLFSGLCLNCSSDGMVLEDSSPLDKEESNSTESSDDWVDPQTFLLALEKFEAWIFSRIIESVWWQTLTPHMQSAAAKSSSSRKTTTRKYGLGDQEQGNFSVELWKKAFKDACERLCPIRACGHECGCLAVLAKLVMEQLVGRLDIAMFNAILRESAEEMPTDPVSDPISDSKVLPIPAGKSSFGAGVQLKNAIGNWSRWLTDLFGIDDNDGPEDSKEVGDDKNAGSEASFKAFCLLNALSDLMMLPSDMLVDRSTRKEVCPKFSAPLIGRVLNNFVPDEFNPNPVSEAVFEALEEDHSEAGEESITNFPCMATPTVYSPPPAASLAGIIGEVGNQALQRSRSSVLKKSYTSDDELDELDSPINSIIIENPRDSPTSKAPNWLRMGKGGRKVVRYQLIREIWKDGE
ncbi:uncharacterized protein LOC111317981 [Durio zibethinus]|uniref:Uncharacterized protein LOC111317981 n=1 Tax=Durio zibethinus TaxID=66656 RepID=A0A6P6BGQ8_DURZI|nr:uncharacterized protein LOC111317981 [Durio zibethinus]XP_022776287.1 uncharacterized protein LOC111317981 [Durio zibethinus]XP_022776288.1 uncharacterized protein LOC111317981 [Durio zibethinus]XP_022776289.1 uncharacterized protein LOC111317981 [Durio zibethinus]XP_022776290.1 uncharacterized protein LOC111317981 [Durio zibethinus]